MDLYYVIEENGYHIYDRNDSLFHVHQYEPYIPDKSKTYEENAQAQITKLMATEEERYTLDEAADIIAKEVAGDEI